MRAFLSVLTVSWLAACGPNTGGSGSGQAAPRPSSNLVTAEEIQRHGSQNLEEILKILRPTWFRVQPTRVTGGAAIIDPIVVYVDGHRMGGVGHLRDVPVSVVIQVRYYSASEAQGRFGLDNLQGAIDVVTTR